MIVFDNVCFTYKETGQVIFDNLSFHLEAGRIMTVTGESGFGKTTLIKLLLRELLPDSGRIIVNGRDIGLIKPKKLYEYRRRIGVVFQNFCLIEDITAFENVALAFSMAGGADAAARKKSLSVFNMLGITNLHKRYPKELSGGEKQKVCLARAIVNNPGLLIMDEPTGNLDPQATDDFFRLFKLINSQGITMVLATHDVDNAAMLNGVELRL